jgi:type II secretion system protein J
LPGIAPRGAFTLLELLVALVMVSALTVALFDDLRIGFKARAGGEAAVEPSRTAEGAMDILRVDLESALEPNANATTTAGIFQGNFEGSSATDERSHESDVLDFCTTGDSPEHVDANGEIKQVELAVEVPSGSNDHVLVRRVLRNLTAQIPPDPDEEVICRGVSAFQLEYFDGTQWQPSWDSTEETDAASSATSSTGSTSTATSSSGTTGSVSGPLPAAVRVTLELERPQPNGSVKTIRFVRVFQLSCSTTIPGESTSSGGSGAGL